MQYRFWEQGYWQQALQGRPYHISALFVVDLNNFRRLEAGDRLRSQYNLLSYDPSSLANLDQDLPNNLQRELPIYTLEGDWLWCETWCSDLSKGTAKSIDLVRIASVIYFISVTILGKKKTSWSRLEESYPSGPLTIKPLLKSIRTLSRRMNYDH